MKLIGVDDLRSGMVVSIDIKRDGKLIMPKGKVLNFKDIEKVSNQLEVEHDKVWVYDLIEIKPLLMKDTIVTKQYVDFMVTGFRDIFNTALSDQSVCDTLVKNFQMYFEKNRDLLYEELLLRDNHCYTYEHSMNVALYGLLMGLKLGLTTHELTSLSIGCILHDIGKIDISNALLDKPARLDFSEFKAIQQHPIYGVERVSHMGCVDDNARRVIEQHHEKLDGSGYPYNLTEDNISHLAKIASVADIFDAVTSTRSYHTGRPIQRGIDIIRSDAAGGKIGKEEVEALVSQLIFYPINTMVTLSNGVSGLVIQSFNDSRPVVQSFEDDKIYDLREDKSLHIVNCL